MKTLIQQYKQDIRIKEQMESELDNAFSFSLKNHTKTIYLNAIDCMINYHENVRKEFMKDNPKYKDIGTGNTIPMLQEQRKQIEEL